MRVQNNQKPCLKFTENNVPSHYDIHVRHFHSGNSTRTARKGHKYHTVCTVRDKTTKKILGIGRSWCSKSDTASRGLGRAVAVGRALKQATISELTELKMVVNK